MNWINSANKWIYRKIFDFIRNNIFKSNFFNTLTSFNVKALLLWYYVDGTRARRFLCLFWRENKQRPELEISDETGSGGGKAGSREARVGVRKGTQRRETQRGSRERTAEGTSQDELVVQSRQRSAEGSSEVRPVKMSRHSK